MQNLLSKSESRYLQQHSHNPVNWFPWGEEALKLAKDQDKPILLSIGYSSCYWCHVMERESFSDEKVAALMNNWFINIKLDREERPDLDDVYMFATQVISGAGGWPNNVFLTPELKPFFAGTYFPPDDTHGRPSFGRVLSIIHDKWKNERSTLTGIAEQIEERLKRFKTVDAQSLSLPSSELAHTLFDYLKQNFDFINGGFYNAPKFPNEESLSFLLEYSKIHDERSALDIVEISLENMARGGINDLVGGGFHRYSTDSKWRVPHFEKMLYNQALLACNYAELYSITKHTDYQDVCLSILDFVAHSMKSPDDLFYSSFNAESDATEGKYYVWNEKELKEILGDNYPKFSAAFGLESIPEIPGHNHPDGRVLYLKEGFKRNGFIEELSRLHDGRTLRQAPDLDDKVITAWNGMMIEAFAKTGKYLENDSYILVAEKTANRFITLFQTHGELSRTIGKEQVPACFEDYSALIKALAVLHAITGKNTYLEAAEQIIWKADELFSDQDSSYFFSIESNDLILRTKDFHDSATPSSNGMMLLALLKLYETTSNTLWLNKASRIISAFGSEMEKRPELCKTLVHGSMIYQKLLAGADHVQAKIVKHTAFVAGKAFSFDIVLVIEDGWHINAHEACKNFLTPLHIEVVGQTEKPIEISYPPAGNLEDIKIYEGKVIIPVRVITKDLNSLEIKISFQPCSKEACALPSTINLKL